jgi:hypothetical protein
LCSGRNEQGDEACAIHRRHRAASIRLVKIPRKRL